MGPGDHPTRTPVFLLAPDAPSCLRTLIVPAPTGGKGPGGVKKQPMKRPGKAARAAGKNKKR